MRLAYIIVDKLREHDGLWHASVGAPFSHMCCMSLVTQDEGSPSWASVSFFHSVFFHMRSTCHGIYIKFSESLVMLPFLPACRDHRREAGELSRLALRCPERHAGQYVTRSSLCAREASKPALHVTSLFIKNF